VLARLARFFRLHAPWTATAALPGGDFQWNALQPLTAHAVRTWPFLGADEALRLTRAYGTRLERVLGVAKSREEVGPWFGPLSAAEVRYLMQQEWARTADDVLWRRTKLGLVLNSEEKAAVAAFMAGESPRA
jgi:glycerol-3-phosphate dehydrogenase